MVDLGSYIRQQLQAGYDINAVRAALLKYGYPQAQVDAALRQAYVQKPTEIKHVIHFSPAVIIIIAVFVVIVGGLLAFSSIRKAPTTPQKLLDLTVDIPAIQLYRGDALSFNVEALNLGGEGRYDIQLRYIVTDSANKVIKTKEETIALDTRVSISAQVQLPPGIRTGNYQLKVTAKYEGGLATATDSFSVEEKAAEPEPTPEPTPSPPVTPTPTPEPTEPTTTVPTTPTTCDDNDACTTDTLVGTECTYQPITPCCGNDNCEGGESFDTCPEDCPPPSEDTPLAGLNIWDSLNKVEDIALTKPKDAAALCINFEDQDFQDKCYARVAVSAKSETYCNNIVGEREKDKCLRNVAKETSNVVICDRIISDVTRDSCYMDFVTKGNYDICDKITNTYHKNSCETLKKFNIPQA